jgi:hypothetical protein
MLRWRLARRLQLLLLRLGSRVQQLAAQLH